MSGAHRPNGQAHRAVEHDDVRIDHRTHVDDGHGHVIRPCSTMSLASWSPSLRGLEDVPRRGLVRRARAATRPTVVVCSATRARSATPTPDASVSNEPRSSGSRRSAAGRGRGPCSRPPLPRCCGPSAGGRRRRPRHRCRYRATGPRSREKPRASPFQAWPSAARLTSLSTTKGTSRRSRSSDTSGKPCQCTLGPPMAMPRLRIDDGRDAHRHRGQRSAGALRRRVSRSIDSTSVSNGPPSASLARTSSTKQVAREVRQHGVALGAAQVDADDAAGEGIEADASCVGGRRWSGPAPHEPGRGRRAGGRCG